MVDAGVALRWVLDEPGSVAASELLDGRGLFAPPLQALELARLLDHPVYDCTYLALAIALERPVITADRRFAAAVSRNAEAAPFVQLLAVEGH